MFRTIEFAYDPLFRLITQTADSGGENIVTRYLYCDTAVTQDRMTVDPDGFWTRIRFDNSGRVATTERFLNANAGNLGDACADPTGPVYRTTNSYNTNGYLRQQVVENKDQDGNPLTPATITTMFGYDDIGRLTLQTVDPGGIGQESNFDYNWLGEIERQFDTSGRGTSRIYDGRGLVKSETPLALDETPDTNLTTAFTYDAMGNLRFTDRPTMSREERVYDDFDRLKQTKRIPGPDGGNTITTTFTYDADNHVTRTVVDEAATVLSDSTAKFDEGGFNYESRQRTVAATDNQNDPLTQRKFDWAGNVTEEKSLGDATVADRVITTEYDGANRVRKVTDNLGGETIFARDDRGNVTEQIVKIDGSNSALTTTVYDALSRAIQVTSPEDGAGGRPDRVRRYDFRNNLLRETMRDAADVPKLTTVFGYDNAGRQTRSAVLASAASTILASAASVTTDRVTDSVFDPDGRLEFRRTYNNSSATALNTTTAYDDLGRVDRVTDPSNSYIDEDYADNGRLSLRSVFDGVGTRTFTFGYDGHDRIKQQTAVGSPNLVTMFTLDGLDRQKRITDPKGIAARTDFDLVGRRKTLVEDDGGALERQTDFGHNRLSQLITQTAKNKTSTGSPLPDQLTTYRYDSLGRQTRIVYPDSTQHADPPNCTDCVRQTFDLTGRMTQRIDPRLLTTAFTYEDRGALLTRTTGTDRDTFGYDAVGRITLADRGTTVDQDAVSHSVMAYTDLGDLDFETQAIAGGTARMVDYGFDQAGNRKQLTYPGGEVLTYTPTVLNQVDAVNLNASPLLDYVYQGRLLDKRRTTTTAPGGTTIYEYDVGYDSHRRVSGIANRFQPGGGSPQSVVTYGFTHDNSGNPLSQTATEGMAEFVADDRAFTVDRLNRLTGTEYFENGQVESTTFDRVGNRESHTDRAGTVTAYGTVNAANEYPTIGGNAVSYDAAGNLSVDQAGRQYTYDEHNRLKQVRGQVPASTVLATYTYDALGRRITFNDPVAGVTTRYYYDGTNAVEERSASDVRLRYHVHGSQYVDERLATYPDLITVAGTGEPTYYLLGTSFSTIGIGNSAGTLIQRLDYSSTGDFAGGGPGAGSYYHDSDADLDLDLKDFASFQNCFSGAALPSGACAALHDRDALASSDGLVNLSDYEGFFTCFRGLFVTPDQACGIPQRAGMPPASGTFGMHGRAFDVLSGGFVLQNFRARDYVPQLGRWLQRDPSGYLDGGNLYESFRANAIRFRDPRGRQEESEGGLFREFFDALDNFYYLFATPEGYLERATETNPVRREIYRHLELQFEATAALAQRAEPVVARGIGVVQTVGGVAEAGTGAVLVVVSEGFGAAPGTIFVLHGVDVTQAGVRQVISGRFTPTETYSVIAQAGYPTTALVVDVGISLSSGISAAGLAVEAVPLRALSSATRVSPTPASLVAEFPAVSQTGEVNLLNVVRRGVPLTTAEATAGLAIQPVEAFPSSTRFFQERILGDLIRYGGFRGRYGNIGTRIATVNQITLLESSGLTPRLEFRVPAPGRASGSIFVDVAGLNAQRAPVRFIELVKAHDPSYEAVRRSLIQRVYPGATIEFVVSAP